jgi:hypothetical protein
MIINDKARKQLWHSHCLYESTGREPNPTSLTAAMAVFQAASVSDAAFFCAVETSHG